MRELISRQAAIVTAISGLTREIDGEKWIRVSEVRESIKGLPIIENRLKGKWIETKDELPSGDNDLVIAVVREKDTGFIWMPRVMVYIKYINDWLFQNERGWLSDEVNQGLEVIAWCPLPEPYTSDMKGEE